MGSIGNRGNCGTEEKVMATATKNKKPGEPSPAQIRARRKFAKMAKERAKAARAAKRAAKAAAPTKKRTVATKAAKKAVVRKPAKKAAPKRNAEHRDAQHPIHVRQYWQGRKGYETPWQRAHKAGQKQLFAMNSGIKETKLPDGKTLLTCSKCGRVAYADKGHLRHKPGCPVKAAKSIKKSVGRSNPTSVTKAKQLRKEFLGTPAKKVTTMYAPKGSGARGALGLMGKLKRIKIKGRKSLDFSKAGAVLAQSGKRKMFVLGKGYTLNHLPGKKRNPDGFVDLGEITTIEYEATKAHLGDTAPVTYYHHMGEEGGAKPHALVNDEGLLLIDGGDYTITSAGIIN
jgi:uncharacterized C2H2 Zn-finger protein